MDDEGVLRLAGNSCVAQGGPGTVRRPSIHLQDRPVERSSVDGHQDPVGPGGITVETELEFDLGAAAGDAGVVLVGKEAAFHGRKRLTVHLRFDPRSRSIGAEAIRKELRRLVVIGAG